MEIEDITGKPMKALDLFSISINHMKQSLLKKINEKVAINICDNQIDFVLTVPAILGDSGKLFMQEAAIQVRILFDKTLWYTHRHLFHTWATLTNKTRYLTRDRFDGLYFYNSLFTLVFLI